MAIADPAGSADPAPEAAPRVAAQRGGAFLTERRTAHEVQIPERFDDELRMIAQSAEAFVTRDVKPDLEALEALDYDLSRALVARAGEAGLLGVEVPEAYGGLGHTKTAACLVAEKMASAGSFNVTFNAHASIGTLPLVYFGTDEQKARYLPKLASGAWVAAYCLSEPESGSDALAARTRATLEDTLEDDTLEDDGSHYRLDGTKMWISNAGFADLFTIFAQVDGEKFSCFLVERDTPGLSLGAEEHKMGISGSSTRQVILENARVPAENLLGEVGQGHRIALGILNLGRLKLAAGAVGGAKDALRESATYALARRQFGRPIAEFGLIREKVGAMAAEGFALESALYRVCGAVDARLEGAASDAEALAAINEYVVEYSLLKVHGSEILDRTLDEALQIHGGYGYSAEYPIERPYRNSRINRIFEGTNEINRLLIVDQLLKRALRGELELMDAARDAAAGRARPEAHAADAPDTLRGAVVATEGLKATALAVAGMAAAAYDKELEREQEVVARISDLVAAAYLAESAVLRAEALIGTPKASVAATLARLYAATAVDAARGRAREALRRLPGGREALPLLGRYLPEGPDTVELRRAAAEACYEAQGYPL